MAAKNYLTVGQRKECLALGATMGELNEMEDRGYEYADILDLCRTASEARLSEKDADADRTAKAHKRAMRPENERHPGKSVFSYPEGDVARPRPALKCQMFWLNEPVDTDTTTAKEIELLNQLERGRYKLERPDGSLLRVDVITEQDDLTGKLGKLTVSFDTRNNGHRNLPSRVFMLQECIKQQTPGLVTA